MTVNELAAYIEANIPGINYPGYHLHGAENIVSQITRHYMNDFVHITNEHIFECCAKANSFEEHIALCMPLAKIDTENFHRERLKPPPTGRTKRKFR